MHKLVSRVGYSLWHLLIVFGVLVLLAGIFSGWSPILHFDRDTNKRARIQNLQRGDDIKVSSAPFSLPIYLYDATLEIDKPLVLEHLLPRDALERTPIPRHTGFRVRVGVAGQSTQVRFVWRTAVDSGFALDLYDALNRPVGHWDTHRGDTGLMALVGGLYRVELSSTSRLGVDATIVAKAAPIHSSVNQEPASPTTTWGYAGEESSMPRIKLRMGKTDFRKWDQMRTEAEALLSSGIPKSLPKGRVRARLTIDGKKSQVDVSLAGQGFLPHVLPETPSFTVRLNAGPLVRDFSRFKLYSINVQSLLDYVIASMLSDEGIHVPRKFLTRVSLNNRELGLYVAEEVPASIGHFEALKRPDGTIFNYLKDYVSAAGVWQPKRLYTRGETLRIGTQGRYNQQYLAKTLALLVRLQTTHALEVRDLRLFRSTLLDNLEVWMRDIDTMHWSSPSLGVRALLTHGGWLYERNGTSYHSPHRNPKMFPRPEWAPDATDNYGESPYTTGFAAIHPMLTDFAQSRSNRALLDQYLAYYTSRIFHHRVIQRLNNLANFLRTRPPRDGRVEAHLNHLYDVLGEDDFITANNIRSMLNNPRLLVVINGKADDKQPQLADRHVTVSLVNLSGLHLDVSLSDNTEVGKKKETRHSLHPSTWAFALTSPKALKLWLDHNASERATVNHGVRFISAEAGRRIESFIRLTEEDLDPQFGRSLITVTPSPEKLPTLLSKLKSPGTVTVAGSHPLAHHQLIVAMAGNSELEQAATANTDGFRPLPTTSDASQIYPIIRSGETLIIPDPSADPAVPRSSRLLQVKAEESLRFILSFTNLDDIDGIQTLLDFEHNEYRGCALQLSGSTDQAHSSLTWICSGQAITVSIESRSTLTVTGGYDPQNRQSWLMVGDQLIVRENVPRPIRVGTTRVGIGNWLAGGSRNFQGNLSRLAFAIGTLTEEQTPYSISAKMMSPPVEEKRLDLLAHAVLPTNATVIQELPLAERERWGVGLWVRLAPQKHGSQTILDLSHTAKSGCMLSVEYGENINGALVSWLCSGKSIQQDAPTDQWIYLLAGYDHRDTSAWLSVNSPNILHGKAQPPFMVGTTDVGIGHWLKGPGRDFPGSIRGLTLYYTYQSIESIRQHTIQVASLLQPAMDTPGPLLVVQDTPELLLGTRQFPEDKTTIDNVKFDSDAGFAFSLWINPVWGGNELQNILDFHHSVDDGCVLARRKATTSSENQDEKISWYCAGRVIVERMKPDQWHYVTGGYDSEFGGNIWLSVDGRPVGQNHLDHAPVTGWRPVGVGHFIQSTGREFHGEIKDLLLHSGNILSSGQLQKSILAEVAQGPNKLLQKKAVESMKVVRPSLAITLVGSHIEDGKSIIKYVVSNISAEPLILDPTAFQFISQRQKLNASVKSIRQIPAGAALDVNKPIALNPMLQPDAWLATQYFPYHWPSGIVPVLAGSDSPHRPNSVVVTVVIPQCHKAFALNPASLAMTYSGQERQIVLHEKAWNICPSRQASDTNIPLGYALKPVEVLSGKELAQRNIRFNLSLRAESDDRNIDTYPKYVTDDDMGSLWIPYESPSRPSQSWIYFVFSEPYHIDRAKLWSAHPAQALLDTGNLLELQASHILSPITQWTTVGTFHPDESEGPLRLAVNTTWDSHGERYRYYRLIARNKGDLQIREITFESQNTKPWHPTVDIREWIAGGEFIVSRDDPLGSLSVSPRSRIIRIDDVLEIPADIRLTLPAGTELHFGESGGILSFGPIHALGTSEAPVIFRPQSAQEHFIGVAVVDSAQPSLFRHVDYSGAKGGFLGAHQISGGLTVSGSEVAIKHSQFINLPSNDGIHISHGRFSISDTKIARSFSDAIDIDWSFGEIRDSQFHRCGNPSGDCVDLSSSRVFLRNLHITNATDKGVSIGEGAVVDLENITVANSNSGVAVKDGSIAKINGCQLTDLTYGLLIYRKKPYYTYPSLHEAGCRFSGNGVDREFEDQHIWTRRFD